MADLDPQCLQNLSNFQEPYGCQEMTGIKNQHLPVSQFTFSWQVSLRGCDKHLWSACPTSFPSSIGTIPPVLEKGDHTLIPNPRDLEKSGKR